MPKQLAMYENAKPLSKENHKKWSIKSLQNYKFANKLNAIPLTAVEFPAASKEYTIIFAGKDDDIMPFIVTGVRKDENLYVKEDGGLDSRYVPAFLRRYPFIFSTLNDKKQFALCIDEAYEGFNQDDLGERLFDGEGSETMYLKSVMEFLKEYQVQFLKTKAFCKKLVELNLLEPMGARFKSESGEDITLKGFMAVNRQKLKEITGETLEILMKTDSLELIYTHLNSMKNFSDMRDKIATVKPKKEEAVKDKKAKKEEVAKKD